MRILLLPFSFIFRIAVAFRNMLYNSDIIRSKMLEPKIISVGNIAAGGTGKTPFVELIAEYLLTKKKNIAVVVKGYKREYDDIKVVEFGFANEKHQLNTENLGDEALLLLENLSWAGSGLGLLIVGDDKLTSAKFVSSKFKPELIIVDDGFQHRKLFRDLDIVILNSKTDKYMIPAGNLREPVKNHRRADILVINNKFEKNTIVGNWKNKPKIVCNYIFEDYYNISGERMNSGGDVKATVFSGIAEPDSFKMLLEENKVMISDFIVFPDHHSFTLKDLDKIIKSYDRTGSTHLITTQKDFVRIKNSELVLNAKSDNNYKKLLYNYPLYYAKIKMQIDQNAELLYKEVDNLLRTE
ncbi:MAG: tetraacyldisaccharide 4'-kinase [Ignavibacteria bacterium]|nr:tetraacyldisaccharide 4'-kinase [Ignavibacteria bacterium]